MLRVIVILCRIGIPACLNGENKVQTSTENNKKIILLDGGIGQAINKNSTQPHSHPLWSVHVMQQSPEVVVQAHASFIAAGARVITLNNYTATPARLARWGVGHLLAPVHAMAIECAKNAIERAGIARQAVNIAGCLPPLVASYVAAEAHDYHQSYEEYCQLIEQQKESVDLFLIETMSNISEARAAITAVHDYGFDAHVGLTIEDNLSNCLRSGEPLGLAVEQLCRAGANTLMINCSYPEAITKALPILKEATLPFGGYGNGFKSIDSLQPGGTVDSLSARDDMTPAIYTQHAINWIDLGASIVGGCCEIGTTHIHHLAQTLQKNGYSLDKFL